MTRGQPCAVGGVSARGGGASYHGGSVGALWPSEEGRHRSDPGTLSLFTGHCVSSSDVTFQNGHEEEDHFRVAEPEPGGGEPLSFQ